MASRRRLEQPPGACLMGSSPEMALYLTSARCFGAPKTGPLPPQALIDGTGDKELIALLFEMDITRLWAEVDPPPNTRHLAVRTGKRYGKTSLTAQHGREPLAIAPSLSPGACLAPWRLLRLEKCLGRASSHFVIQGSAMPCLEVAHRDDMGIRVQVNRARPHTMPRQDLEGIGGWLHRQSSTKPPFGLQPSFLVFLRSAQDAALTCRRQK